MKPTTCDTAYLVGYCDQHVHRVYHQMPFQHRTFLLGG